MRARPVMLRSVGLALALSVVLLLVGAGEARAAPGWSWPVEGGVITPYSNDEGNPYAGGVHRGIDIAAPVGSTVRAARAGAVTYAGALGYSGLTVAVRTVDGYVTSYLHLSASAVRRGATVAGGARLGAVGTSGRRSKTEPHLHFGVRVAGTEHRYVDPLSLLPPLPGSSSGPAAAPRPVTAPVRAAPAPVPVRPAPVARPVGHSPPARAPVPVLRPVPVRRAPVALGGRRLEGVARARPTSPAALPHVSAPPRDWGRPLALVGVGLVLLVLLGPSVYRIAGGRAAVVADRARTAARATIQRFSPHIRPLLRGQPRARRA